MAKILIVDDDGDVRTLYSLCLLRRGHCILTAGDGAEALACVAVQALDLIITDLDMPVMDGLELLRRLRADGHAALPVVVVSAHANLRDAATAAGANAFLAKPVGLRLLGEIIDRLLAERVVA